MAKHCLQGVQAMTVPRAIRITCSREVEALLHGCKCLDFPLDDLRPATCVIAGVTAHFSASNHHLKSAPKAFQTGCSTFASTKDSCQPNIELTTLWSMAFNKGVQNHGW